METFQTRKLIKRRVSFQGKLMEFTSNKSVWVWNQGNVQVKKKGYIKEYKKGKESFVKTIEIKGRYGESLYV